MQLHISSFLVAIATFTSLNALALADQQVLNQDQGGFNEIKKALSKAGIIGDVIDDFQPKCFVVPFFGKKDQYPVSLGNIFKKKTTKHRPSMKIYCPYINTTTGLTVALTDPDAPSKEHPKWGENCHWLAVVTGLHPDPDGQLYAELNFEDKYSAKDDKDKYEFMKYQPPGPPPKTGYHRYVFVLLEGDNTNLTAPRGRHRWGYDKQRSGVRDWAKEEGLEVVGANFFLERNKKQ
ncbi:putative carboxypeptidase Y inhibitor [Halenospora varia]|nr:putative carboxypeptidase Y inhibitor [Halenospora varia]